MSFPDMLQLRSIVRKLGLLFMRVAVHVHIGDSILILYNHVREVVILQVRIIFIR